MICTASPEPSGTGRLRTSAFLLSSPPSLCFLRLPAVWVSEGTRWCFSVFLHVWDYSHKTTQGWLLIIKSYQTHTLVFMSPMFVITTTTPGNIGITCILRCGKDMWAVFSINATNQCFSLSIHWKYHIPPSKGQLRLHSGPAESVELCHFKLVVPTHESEGVSVAVPKAHVPLGDQSCLSAVFLSAARRGWVARPCYSVHLCKSIL